MNTLTPISYIASLQQVVGSKLLGEGNMAALENFEIGAVGPPRRDARNILKKE